MTPEEYQHYIMSKLASKALEDLGLNGVLGIVGEAGEIADLYKKYLFYDNSQWQGWMMEEMGDLLFYFFVLLEYNGWTLEQVILNNVRKLDSRYPEGFDPERSMHRE